MSDSSITLSIKPGWRALYASAATLCSMVRLVAFGVWLGAPEDGVSPGNASNASNASIAVYMWFSLALAIAQIPTHLGFLWPVRAVPALARRYTVSLGGGSLGGGIKKWRTLTAVCTVCITVYLLWARQCWSHITSPLLRGLDAIALLPLVAVWAARGVALVIQKSDEWFYLPWQAPDEHAWVPY